MQSIYHNLFGFDALQLKGKYQTTALSGSAQAVASHTLPATTELPDGQLKRDLQLVIGERTLRLGDALSVTAQSVVLPSLPLSVSQKRQLWSLLCEV
ncbi:hypothetical protein ACFOEE_05330 [Pseudoalteromonas fenneropenaei]|uniref:Uncharacterized protein n=1 Tax=Pseudoalteromonas fenneropenaei TaxID=1737459 RepID=A0ABV7CH01_9GAMM